MQSYLSNEIDFISISNKYYSINIKHSYIVLHFFKQVLSQTKLLFLQYSDYFGKAATLLNEINA